jgi:hypothetical protein
MVASVLAAALLSGMQPGPAASPPLVIDLMPPACPDKPSDADVQVCAKRVPDFRIDPEILAGERAKESPPVSEKDRVKAVMAPDCQMLPTKCQGSGVVPIVPVVLKTVQALAKAAKGEDWREPFRTGTDDYSVYKRATEATEAGDE